jgi:competence protein ComEA
MFASAVLGAAALGGLGWSWNRAMERDSTAALVEESLSAERSADRSADRTANRSALQAGVVKLIDLNSAGAAELDLLPRIGPALAERILADREENGRYDSVDDLRRVSGIGPKTVEKIRAFVTLGDESEQRASASVGEGG